MKKGHAMKLGIIIETADPEKSWNGMRFAKTARQAGHDVKVFLMGAAVELEELHDPHFDTGKVLAEFVERGGEILACGTCLESRKKGGTEACPISTMLDCLDMVEWADKTVTF